MARRRDDDDDYDDDDDDDDDRGRGRRRRDDDDDDDDDDRPRGKKGGAKKRGRKEAGPPIGDYLFFRQLIGPPLVTFIFMAGLAVCLYLFICNISQVFVSTDIIGTDGKAISLRDHIPAALAGPSKLDYTMSALFYLFVAPLIIRGFCEGLACLLRIANSMDALKKPTEGEKAGEPQEKKPADTDEDDEE